MRILRDEAAIATLPEASLRQLIQQRVSEISTCSRWDAGELGPFIVVEPGDLPDALEAEIGFSVLRNLVDDTPFGHADFVPSFEWAEIHPEGYFELVYVLGDGGYGYDLFIADQPGVDPDLLMLCRTYATSAA